MRKFFVLALVVFLTTAMYAQRVDVVETSGIFNKQTHPALATKVMFTDAKTVTKEFISLMKEYKPENLTSKKGLIFADNVMIPSISENPIDVYATVNQKKGSDEVDLTVAFSLGADIFITSTQAPTQYQTAYSMLKVFANDLTQKNHEAMLKVAGKALAKEEKKFASYEKKDASLQKSIDSYKKDIEKLEGKKQKAESKQTDIKKKKEDQSNVVREKRDAYKKIENL